MAIKPFVPTTIDQSLAKRTVGFLLPVVRDCVGLYLAAKHAHWIVSGELFGPLHSAFDSIADLGDGLADTFAERIVSLNGTPSREVGDFTVGPDRDGLVLARQMVDVLLGAAQTVFQAQQSCLEANEQVSANLLMDAASKLDKARWQLSMYLASQADD